MTTNLPSDERPWGKWETIEIEKGYQVKRITVKAHHRLSYQKHRHRSEHWVIVKGKGKVTLNGEDHELERGQYIFIPTHAPHRIENIGEDDLIFIEVQIGDILSEDDIVRLEDDYGRT